MDYIEAAHGAAAGEVSRLQQLELMSWHICCRTRRIRRRAYLSRLRKSMLTLSKTTIYNTWIYFNSKIWSE